MPLKETVDLLKKELCEKEPTGSWSMAPYLKDAQAALPGYITLDERHVKEIEAARGDIVNYLADRTRTRPQNWLLVAEPGSGKSHFVKCLARTIAPNLGVVTFNMATMTDTRGLESALTEVQNTYMNNNRQSILFLDEFDSSASNYTLLLPLLWDGEFASSERRLRIPKSVIVLAGSSPKLIEVMEQVKSMRANLLSNDLGKMVDFMSRINGGVLRIPPLEGSEEHDKRTMDKVCIACELMLRRFTTLQSVPWSLLRFVADTRFRYGVRSIAHFVDMLATDCVQDSQMLIQRLGIPLHDARALLETSLAYHLIAKTFPSEIEKRWESCISGEKKAAMVKIA